ncbi:MAG: hypothetical protein DI535_23425 [Citrobacter freundii]|nr:MAG: hypothetical protein DI535_23425 [Citrobacter freundii]
MNLTSSRALNLILTYVIALVWLLNGLYCKLLNFVPRHQLIVARILGPEHAALFTRLIGLSEILMAGWIISRIQHRLNAITQMIIIAVMNTIEFFYARDLLLFGKWNAMLAAVLIAVIYFNEFVLTRKQSA